MTFARRIVEGPCRGRLPQKRSANGHAGVDGKRGRTGFVLALAHTISRRFQIVHEQSPRLGLGGRIR